MFGDIIRLVRDTTKEVLDECGVNDVKEEIKDIIQTIKN